MFGLFKQQEPPTDTRSPIESEERMQKEMNIVLRQAPVPTLWLFGKTGSGKSSIVSRLTSSLDAKIGQGFRPETKYSRRYDFPNSEETLLRFLDTRGLGEAYYDPTQDIEAFHSSSHLLIVTVRLVDHAIESLIQPLRQFRASKPDRPILLVMTCLHEATPNHDLSTSQEITVSSDGELSASELHQEPLRQLVELKRKQFAGLYDSMALIDFTQPEDGFANNGFGEQRLKQLILEMLPSAYKQTWTAAMSSTLEGKPERQRRAHWQIIASSALAATASAVPLPWVNLPVVLAIQTRMIKKIAEIYQQKVTSKQWIALSNVAGSQIAIRMASRELLKFIPFVGIAASVASSFAFTFASGKVADWYFANLCQGKPPSDEELRAMFADQLARGHQLWATPSK